MASYVSQQQRWATGCLSALPAVVRARLPWRLRLQYLLSASYFLSGWAVLVYMALPVVRVLTGAQPVAGASADQFLLHFAPYFMAALLMVAWAGAGTYTFAAFCLASARFWIGVQSTLRLLFRRPHRFVVTPNRGATVRQPRAMWPALATIGVLVTTALVGLARPLTPAMLNNVSFLCVHVIVLAVGVLPALRRSGAVASERVPMDERAAA
jgi:cellulose synthase (UDP-forming)